MRGFAPIPKVLIGCSGYRSQGAVGQAGASLQSSPKFAGYALTPSPMGRGLRKLGSSLPSCSWVRGSALSIRQHTPAASARLFRTKPRRHKGRWQAQPSSRLYGFVRDKKPRNSEQFGSEIQMFCNAGCVKGHTKFSPKRCAPNPESNAWLVLEAGHGGPWKFRKRRNRRYQRAIVRVANEILHFKSLSVSCGGSAAGGYVHSGRRTAPDFSLEERRK
jgi:hypothetical protein